MEKSCVKIDFSQPEFGRFSRQEIHEFLSIKKLATGLTDFIVRG